MRSTPERSITTGADDEPMILLVDRDYVLIAEQLDNDSIYVMKNVASVLDQIDTSALCVWLLN